MNIRVGRIVIAAIATEVVAILALVAIVGLFGPSDSTSTQQFAERVGLWFGPMSGFVLCDAAAYWVTRGLATGQIPQGVLLGAAAAAIDVILLLLSAAAFQPVFVFSTIGRILAGAIGGWLAAWARRNAA